MFLSLFFALKSAGVPVSLTEHLSLLDAMDKGVAAYDAERFYYLARGLLVKDERHLDRFDKVFGEVFKGLEPPEGAEGDDGTLVDVQIPAEWLKALSESMLSDEEKAKIEAMGGLEKLLETLRQRLAEQRGRHQGGNKWIGTGGTSPFGAYGYNPEGIRIGQAEGRNRRAVKVWDKREFRNLDDRVELGTRNVKMALRRLRKFARTGAPTELDLDGTIRSTAEQGGLLDLKLVPERHNAVKLLLFLDVGGSMDDHIRACEELFSAARSEFKHLEYYYFHNCVYEHVWRDNRRRRSEKIPTWDVLHTYPKDYKLVFVGDASMSPYELIYQGGAVEHWNDEPGALWLHRMLETWPDAAWLNPVPEDYWLVTHSIGMVQEYMAGRMYPLTLEGLDRATSDLSRS